MKEAEEMLAALAPEERKMLEEQRAAAEREKDRKMEEERIREEINGATWMQQIGILTKMKSHMSGTPTKMKLLTVTVFCCPFFYVVIILYHCLLVFWCNASTTAIIVQYKSNQTAVHKK
jgi:hypothetical protein